VNPLLTWPEVATILRFEKSEDSRKEQMRKRRVMRIMREAGGVDVGQSEWRVSEEQLQSWLRINRPELLPPLEDPIGDGKRHTIPVNLRLSVLARDKCCVYCGSDKDLTIDHVIPVIQRGSDAESNLVTACKRCNCIKNGRTPEQANMRISFQVAP
jgi:hypothetical protein